MIVALRERAESMRTAELDRFRARCDDLDTRQLDLVEAVTRGVVAKLLHQPTVVLKDAAGSARGDRLVAALRELFEIES
jgi:glutamyl-tRNA reductase